MNRKSLIELFLSRAKARGKAGHSLYFYGDILYSYGDHFPLAVFTESGLLLNKSKYSPTTSRQQSQLDYQASQRFTVVDTDTNGIKAYIAKRRRQAPPLIVFTDNDI